MPEPTDPTTLPGGTRETGSYRDPVVTQSDALLAISRSIDRMTDNLVKALLLASGKLLMPQPPTPPAPQQKGTPMDVSTDKQGDHPGPVILPMGNPGTSTE